MTDEQHADRRSFLRTGALAGTALVAGASDAFAEEEGSHGPTKGDIAILRFLSAVEQIESDLWQQYNELGGIQDSEVPGGSGSGAYTACFDHSPGLDLDKNLRYATGGRGPQG
jgi:hypothetical protein